MAPYTADSRYTAMPRNRPGNARGWHIPLTVLAGSLLLSCIILAPGVSASGLLIAGLLAVPAAYVIIAYPKAGICLLLVLAYIVMFFTRLIDAFPIGTIMDALEVLLLFGLLLKKKYDPVKGRFNNNITACILLWIGYNAWQLFNPEAASRLAWLYTIRTVAIVAVTYFIFLYHINDTGFLRLLLKLWLALSLFAALYTLKQELFGFFPFEEAWLQSDPSYTRLYYIGNHWRKFSIFSDPVALAYNMVASCILCCCLATGPLSLPKKIILLLMAAVFFAAMLYSGTRAAFILVPAAFMLFAVLRFNRAILITGTILCVIMAALLIVPTSNPTLYRFQTAFRPADDASYQVRKYNQQRIRPYILSHPIGGGLGATGIWGKRFSPGTELAGFPPDSGYVRVAAELGWIGLLLFCTLMFEILRTGIRIYFRIRDPELRSYCLAMVLMIFALNLGNYPQEALVQYPVNVYFYLMVALLPVLRRLDNQIHKPLSLTDPKLQGYGA